MSSEEDEKPYCTVEEVFDGPIDNFLFRQCPAEFNLKARLGETHAILPSWTANPPPKSSIVQISHSKGIIMFPHPEKGGIGFAPINNLAEKESLVFESLLFPGDDSFILAACMDSKEDFLFIAKGSNKLYAIDLASESLDKRPFISKIVQLEHEVVDCVASDLYGLWVLLDTGKLLNFSTKNDVMLQEIKTNLNIVEEVEIGCISPIREAVMILGAKHESSMYIVDLADSSIQADIIDVPCENLNCGSNGISSIFLLPGRDSVLFSCVPDDEEDDVPLIIAENLDFLDDLHFAVFFDPCASKPSRQNQFYFSSLPVVKWADNLVDLVLVGNYASPDVGLCGRLSEEDGFQPFYIDNDEGLAQLPFERNELSYPVGLAMDFSSQSPVENLSDADAPKYPPAPILWVLTNSALICPFYLLKTDETEKHAFMRKVKPVEFKPEERMSVNESVIKKAEPVIPKVEPVNTASFTFSSPQTPSKVPLQQLASLQKSTEIHPVKQPVVANESFNFKAAPVVPAVAPGVVIMEEPEPVLLVRPKEKTESISVDAYRNILLTEVALTHESMQEDIFTLKQISQKNSQLLRQNSQKYFNALGSLESYASSLESLISSSDKVLQCIYDRLDQLKFDLTTLMSRTRQIKGSWNRIKHDHKINWDSRIKHLTLLSNELFERIDRVRSFMANPVEARKYPATLKGFVDSVQEKIQTLMAHLSGLFVGCQNDEISQSLKALNLCPSSDSLSEQFNSLSVLSTKANSSKTSSESLLKSVKSRGARLLIPARVQFNQVSDSSPKPKLSSVDESLIESFISAVRLTDEVPEFPEITFMSRLSLNESSPKSQQKKEEPPREVKTPIVSSVPSASDKAQVKVSSISPAIKQQPVFKTEAEEKTIPKLVSEPVFDVKASEPKPTTNPFSFSIQPPIATTKTETTTTSSVSSYEKASPSFSFNISASSKPVSLGIPSIFNKEPTESVLKKEIPLPSFDSFSVSSSTAAASNSDSSMEKKSTIPGIFSLKTTTPEVEKEEAKSTFTPLKTEPQIFNMPSLNTENDSFSFSKESGKQEKTAFASDGSQFSISTKPIFAFSTPPINTSSSSSITPTFGSTSISAPNTVTPAFGSVSTINPSAFGSGTSNASPPVFGSTSLPSAIPVFGSATIPQAPSFGSVSTPAAASNVTPTVGGGGFAAFASQSSSGGGFSSFANASSSTNPTAAASTGLTFASFLPANNTNNNNPNPNQPNDSQNSNSKSSFSFTGFRD